jgi:hypothetical protein
VLSGLSICIFFYCFLLLEYSTSFSCMPKCFWPMMTCSTLFDWNCDSICKILRLSFFICFKYWMLSIDYFTLLLSLSIILHFYTFLYATLGLLCWKLAPRLAHDDLQTFAYIAWETVISSAKVLRPFLSHWKHWILSCYCSLFLMIIHSCSILIEPVSFSVQCGSSRSVAPIKAGFVAQVGRRKAWTHKPKKNRSSCPHKPKKF